MISAFSGSTHYLPFNLIQVILKDIFTKVGSEVAKKAASEDAKKALEKAGTQALEAGMKRLGDEAGKYAGEKLFQKKAPTPKPHGDIIMKELTKDQEKNADFEARLRRLIAGAGRKMI